MRIIKTVNEVFYLFIEKDFVKYNEKCINFKHKTNKTNKIYENFNIYFLI